MEFKGISTPSGIRFCTSGGEVEGTLGVRNEGNMHQGSKSLGGEAIQRWWIQIQTFHIKVSREFHEAVDH